MAYVYLSHAWRSETGKVRPNNEDAIAIVPTEGAFFVADGMGGGRDGELASAWTAEGITRALTYLRKAQPLPLSIGLKCDRIAAELARTSARLLAHAGGDPNAQRCGSTVAGVVFDAADPGRITTLHAGDSRVYRWRKGALKALTRDHNLGNTEEMAGMSLAPRFKAMLTRGVGLSEEFKLDRQSFDVRAGDILLVCSDGLSGYVKERQIAKLIGAGAATVEPDGRLAMKSVASALVDAALESGGRDNCTVCVVRIDYLPEPVVAVLDEVEDGEPEDDAARSEADTTQTSGHPTVVLSGHPLMPSPTDASGQTDVPAQADAPTQAGAPTQTDTPTQADALMQADAPTQADAQTQADAPKQAGTPAQGDAPTQEDVPTQMDVPVAAGAEVGGNAAGAEPRGTEVPGAARIWPLRFKKHRLNLVLLCCVTLVMGVMFWRVGTGDGQGEAVPPVTVPGESRIDATEPTLPATGADAGQSLSPETAEPAVGQVAVAAGRDAVPLPVPLPAAQDITGMPPAIEVVAQPGATNVARIPPVVAAKLSGAETGRTDVAEIPPVGVAKPSVAETGRTDVTAGLVAAVAGRDAVPLPVSPPVGQDVSGAPPAIEVVAESGATNVPPVVAAKPSVAETGRTDVAADLVAQAAGQMLPAAEEPRTVVVKRDDGWLKDIKVFWGTNSPAECLLKAKDEFPRDSLIYLRFVHADFGEEFRETRTRRDDVTVSPPAPWLNARGWQWGGPEQENPPRTEWRVSGGRDWLPLLRKTRFLAGKEYEFRFADDDPAWRLATNRIAFSVKEQADVVLILPPRWLRRAALQTSGKLPADARLELRPDAVAAWQPVTNMPVAVLTGERYRYRLARPDYVPVEGDVLSKTGEVAIVTVPGPDKWQPTPALKALNDMRRLWKGFSPQLPTNEVAALLDAAGKLRKLQEKLQGADAKGMAGAYLKTVRDYQEWVDSLTKAIAEFERFMETLPDEPDEGSLETAIKETGKLAMQAALGVEHKYPLDSPRTLESCKQAVALLDRIFKCYLSESNDPQFVQLQKTVNDFKSFLIPREPVPASPPADQSAP